MAKGTGTDGHIGTRSWPRRGHADVLGKVDDPRRTHGD
jgi:hypothetical protein